jgi:hypothetical protein
VLLGLGDFACFPLLLFCFCGRSILMHVLSVSERKKCVIRAYESRSYRVSDIVIIPRTFSAGPFAPPSSRSCGVVCFVLRYCSVPYDYGTATRLHYLQKVKFWDDSESSHRLDQKVQNKRSPCDRLSGSLVSPSAPTRPSTSRMVAPRGSSQEFVDILGFRSVSARAQRERFRVPRLGPGFH